ncbi:unnamed protein product [Mytilus coruscus]|uniref:EGF-like domain-containing protein n=1 Tax=Mytilus coruscus TaxID=42192 RepID=A0A6J8A8B2_MYTCO|nr:unnamed protein product [Mytilus coruscus]
MTFKLSLVLCCVFLFIGTVQPWSGHVCQRLASYFRYNSYCRCWSWWWCTHWGGVRRTYYYTENYCCPGWRHNGDQDCIIPICSPQCKNFGKCVNPNACECTAGHSGDICNGTAACSHLFLVTLDVVMEATTVCAQKGSMEVLAKLYSHREKNATNRSEVDLVWTNSDEFNVMKFDIDASIDVRYNFDHIPPVPRYIRNMKFGIVDANVLVIHYKHGQSGEYEVNREKFTCPQLSDLNPIANKVLECRMDNGTNVFQVDSGDR